MKTKETKIIKNLLVVAIALPMFVLPFGASAQTPMIEVTAPDLPFSASNLLPGNSISAEITIKNNLNKSHQAQIMGANLSDPANLASQMTLTLSGDGANQSLSFDEIFSEAATLSKIPSGESRTYTLVLTFNEDAPQESYEGKSLGFDFIIALDDCDTGGCEIAISGTNSSGGGGGGTSGGSHLLIFGEESTVGVPTETSSQITWETSKPATSQVIYGPASATYNLDINTLPCMGYPSCTTETTLKVTDHSITLTGLTPGETYAFRVVSRASPPTVSFEHIFTVPISETQRLAASNFSDSSSVPQGEILGVETQKYEDGEESGLATTTEEISENSENEDVSNQVAAIGAAAKGFQNPWLLFLIIIILILIIIYLLRKGQK